MIDITDVNILSESTKGKREKFNILYNDGLYILKISRKINGTLTREHIAEYVTYLLCKYMGIDCQEVFLTIYKGEPVAVIKNFLIGMEIEHPYEEINDSSLYDEYSVATIPYNLEYILHTMYNYKNLDETKYNRELSFWNMLLIDAIIANSDRHWNNWGVIGSVKHYTHLAPLYDHGSSLFTKYREKELRQIMLNEQRWKELIYDKPLSQIKIDNKRVSYYDILHYGYNMGYECKLKDVINDFASSFTYSIIECIYSDKMLNEFVSGVELNFICNILWDRFRYLIYPLKEGY